VTPTETERHELWKGLSGLLPEEQVRTLMDSLPPVDWQELATKTDLAALEERMDLKSAARFAEIGARFAEIAARFAKIDARFTEIDAKFEGVDAEFKVVHGKFERVEGRIDKRVAQLLVGVAVLLTPIYLALFTGFGG